MFFFFNDTATTEIYTLSLHDALPILGRDHTASSGDYLAQLSDWALSLGIRRAALREMSSIDVLARAIRWELMDRDRKSTRLNSSHANISYAVFCLKKKKKQITLSHFL